MQTDDVLDALGLLRAAAEAAEPAATALVRRAAEHADGRMVRLDTRFKIEASIVAKLERFRNRRPPHYDLGRFNDALRYTIVIDDENEYWAGCLAAIEVLGDDGFTVTTDRLGWRREYAGLNLTVEDAAARLFEVQLHTPASLAMSEQTHPQYAEWRAMDTRSSAARFIRRGLDAAAARVPLPPGVPRV